jgi:hypothetical protein
VGSGRRTGLSEKREEGRILGQLERLWTGGELVGTQDQLGTLLRTGCRIQHQVSGCGVKTQEVTENEVRGQAFSHWVFNTAQGKNAEPKEEESFLFYFLSIVKFF